MKLTKSKLKQIIKEELMAEHEASRLSQLNDEAYAAYKSSIDAIGKISKNLSDDDSYNYLLALKEWFDRNVIV